MKKLMKILAYTLALALVALTAGCAKTPQTGAGAAATQTASASNTEEAYSGPVRNIVVGTGNDMNYYCFLDENGNLAGLEYDILTRVDELLPQYKFEFQTAEFKSILIGLGAGKYDIAAHNYAKNAEREANYLFGDVPYTHYSYKITVKKGRTDIQTIADLEGKTVLASSGNNVSYLLENYNKTAKTPINLTYGTLDPEPTIKSIEDGRVDAIIQMPRTVDQWNEAYGDRLDTVGEELLPGYTYYIFKKGDDQLKNDVDGALQKLRDDGTLSQLSIKWLKQDYSQLVPELENQK